MAYKTLMLQLYRPSKRKRTCIDNALLHYSQALQILMDCYREKVEVLSQSGTQITQRLLLGLIDKETVKSLNVFGVQPFKDSLKIEFASIAATFIEQKRNYGKAGYPLTFLDSSRYNLSIFSRIGQLDSGQISLKKFEHECSKLINRVDKSRSLYFGRYSMHRDYCLLYDEFKDRFYAKLYLFNRTDGFHSENITSGLSLRYIAPGMPALLNQAGKKRYIIVPLAFGKRQYDDLKKTIAHPELLHTARLLKKENHYYLMVNMACNSESVLETSTTMGIAKSPFGGLNYTICDNNGIILKNDGILEQAREDQVIYNFSTAIVKIALKNRSQVILESNGGKNDQMPVQNASKAALLSVGQYKSLANILKYKLPEKRLPPPIEVSANGLFFICPNCQNRTIRNKVSNELFACIKCGYASEFKWIGGINLAKRLIKYRNDKIPITVLKKENYLLFYNKNLGFECLLPQNITDYKPMYDKLNQYIQSMDGKFKNNTKKYAIWKKLWQSPNIQDVVRIIPK